MEGGATTSGRADDSGRRSWLNRLSGVYSAAERQLARGAKALHKLAVPSTGLHDYEEAKARLEHATVKLKGQERLTALRRYVTVLEAPDKPAPGTSQPVIVTQPASPAIARGGDEEDWQQLSAVSLNPNAATADKPESKAGVALFVDHTAGEEPAEPMTFRELFLRSNALENIVAGYAQEPPGSQEEEELLSRLLRACFSGSLSEESDDLMAAVMALAGTHAQCQQCGVADDSIAAIQAHVMQAVGSLKLKAEVEMVDRKMAALRGQVADQAAAAALLHKFNSGLSLPAGEVTHQRLLQGLAATQEVMQLVESLCKLAGDRTGLVVDAPTGPHQGLLGAIDQRLAELGTSSSEADLKLEDNQNQRHESEAFRGLRLNEMEGEIAEVQQEISTLQTERAGLLAQLEKVELALTKAQSKRADLEERQNVFEEGHNFTVEALQHQADELSSQQARSESEMAAVGECKHLVLRSQAAHRHMQQAELEKAQAAVEEVAREYAHAAARHLYFQRAQLQLLLRQLHYCAGELSGVKAKQQRVTSLGMESLLPDVELQRNHLQRQYLEAEAAAAAHLAQVSEVQAIVARVSAEAAAAVTSVASRLASPQAHKGLPLRSEELEELFESVEVLRRELAGLERPEGLPPPGEKLPPLPVVEADEGEAGEQSHASRPHSGSTAQSASPQAASQVQPASATSATSAQTAGHASDLGLEELLEDLGASGRSAQQAEPEPQPGEPVATPLDGASEPGVPSTEAPSELSGGKTAASEEDGS